MFRRTERGKEQKEDAKRPCPPERMIGLRRLIDLGGRAVFVVGAVSGARNDW